MTHEDEGKYGEKRRGAKLDETIASRIKEKISGDRISCAEAHGIAAELGREPSDVGVAIDLLEIRITKCQLGLFGHGKEKNIPVASDPVSPDIEREIKASVVDNRLPCSAAWEIARNLNVPKGTISGACETLKIKISPCQLGAFG